MNKTQVTLLIYLAGSLSTPTHAEPRRHIQLEGQSNFRDIGGYKTSEGKTVKWRQVYRSGELPRLTDKDIATLVELGIKTVVNFLTAEETKARGLDRLPSGTHEVSLPIESDGGLVGVVLEAHKTGDFSKIPVELNPELHRLLVAPCLRPARLSS
jgi:protein-tyrosine phosphatase